MIAELLEPIKQGQFFRKRNSTNETTQLVREVKNKYRQLFNCQAAKLETLPEISPPAVKSIGVSPERMLELVVENKLRRRRYQLRSQEVKLLEQQLEWESKEREAQIELQKYERARKIRNEQIERQAQQRKIRQNQQEGNQGHDYLAEEPLFQRMERIRNNLEKKQAKKNENVLLQSQKPAVDFKLIREHAHHHQQERVERSKPEIQKPDWHPPPASKFHREVWERDMDIRRQEKAKAELQRLLIEKSQKFSTFIRKYLKPKQRKDPKPLYQKQEPRQKVKFSPNFPLMKAKDVIQISQLRSVKSQADINSVKEDRKSESEKVPKYQVSNVSDDALIDQSAQKLREPIKKTQKQTSESSYIESKTLSENKQQAKQIQPGQWATHIETKHLSPEQKYDYVQSAAKTLEQKALRAEAKIKQDAIRSNRSNHSFSRSPRLQPSSSVRVVPVPHTTNFSKQLNNQINDIEMTDTLLVDAIKAKMALLALELSK